ncbi:hypothetical protein BKA70DRAFT_1237131 [Coprinopsis sp. MPI-PUGE-AT-0042]|nr:hypothetical protein BKA70DRAFT_1237131 [Coprinopsis sp. MPI-PUGE-AT-0042]
MNMYRKHTEAGGADAVSKAYQAILRNETNWMLLHYKNDNYDDLVLYGGGLDGLEELKTKIYDLNRVFVAFYRMETEFGVGYILLNYIPPCISGVRRARALVHSRRIGAVLQKHQAVLTVENLSQLTSSSIYRALVDPSYTAPSPIEHSFSHSPVSTTFNSHLNQGTGAYPANTRRNPQPIELEVPRRSFSETYAPDHMRMPQEIQGLSQKISGSRFMGNLLGRRKKEATIDVVPQYADDFVDIPPPVPSKDLPPIPNEKRTPSPPRQTMKTPSPPPRSAPTTQPPAPPPGRAHTSPRWSPPKAVPVAKQRSAPAPLRSRGKREPSPPIILGEDFTVLTPFDVDGYSFGEIPTPKPAKVAYPMDVRTTSLPRKWAASREHLLSDPEERERRRLERVKQQEQEERMMLVEEQKLQEQRRKERDAERQREEQEERRRQAELKEQLKKITVEKEKMRKLEEEEEQRSRREIEERKRLDRERRLDEHRKLELWRKEQDRLREEEARKVALEKKREEEQRLKKIEESGKGGYITIQFPESLFWKRRYFKLMGNTLNLYRNPKDTTTPMEEVQLRGKIKALKEWSDGYEDLEAIPFSFVIEFHDQTWSAFADSEDDKFRVLGLLKHTSGL